MIQNNMKPLHEHDCSTRCIFLGNDGENDYYFHRDPEHICCSTLICRYSSDGWDYSSGKDFCMCSMGINKALELAYTQGILTPEEIVYIKNIQDGWFKYCEQDTSYAKSVGDHFKEEGFTRFVLP